MCMATMKGPLFGVIMMSVGAHERRKVCALGILWVVVEVVELPVLCFVWS